MDGPRFSPEELPRLRAEIERLRAEQVPPAFRQESQWRRVVMVGPEPMEGCLRQLRQAQRGWEALLAGSEHQAALRHHREKQEQLLGLLDLGLALLDRIEALARREKGRRSLYYGGGGGEEPLSGRPFKEEAEEEEAGGGGIEDSPQSPEEEEEGEDDEEQEEEANHPQLDQLRQEVGALEEEVLGLPGIPQVAEVAQVSLLQEKANILQGTLVKFAHQEIDQLDRLEFTLREALLYKAGSSLSLTKSLHKVPKEEAQGLQTFTWDFTRALWHFLQSHSDKDLPAKMMGAWKTEAKVLQEKIRAMEEETLWGKQGRDLWVEMDTPVQRMKKVLWEAASLGMAAADLYRAMAVKASSSEDGLVALQERLAALRRGPLEEVDTLWQTQCRLESTLATLFMTQAIPQEEELLAMQKEASAMVDALNAVSLEVVGALPEKVGTFLGVGGKSSREILDLLGVPLMRMEVLAASVDAVRGDLFRLIESVEPVKTPQRKIRALSDSLEGLDHVLRASGREKVLQDLAPDVPLKDLAGLNKKLQLLSRVLRKRVEVLKNCLLKKAEEIPDWVLAELDLLVPLPSWNVQASQPPRTSKAAAPGGPNAELAPTSTGAFMGTSPKPVQDPGANPEGSHSRFSTPLRCVDSLASVQVTPPQVVIAPCQTRPASSTEMTSNPEAGLGPVAALAQATLSEGSMDSGGSTDHRSRAASSLAKKRRAVSEAAPASPGPSSQAVGKRKKEMILLEVKKEIIRKHEGGMRLRDLAKEYGRSASTISAILKMKEKIMGRDAAKGATVVSKLRPPVLEKVEQLLLLWIEEKQRAGDILTEALICKKAKALHTDLLSQQPGNSASEAEGFKASRGWVERFKARSGIHPLVRHGEATSPDVASAEGFATEFLEVVVSEGYLPQQVFNCDETGLFWKRMPKRTFITQEETSLPGHKPMKDRLTLLLCANASGDLKIKPLLVYHSENPRAFKKHKVKKEQLDVLWRSNPKGWVTHLLFVEWVNLVFGPAVKQYLVDNNLPLKAMLLMDNAPAHPPGLEDVLLEEFQFIRVMFLPPNVNPLLQPMDQQVISSFKKLYTRELFRRCYEMTDGSSLTLREFWREHFDIMSCLQVITMAWAGVSQINLNSAWRNLWPDCVVTPDSSAPAPESTVLEEIVSLGRAMGLEVTEEDVCELVEGHDCELTTEDLVELQKVVTGEQVSLEEEETNEAHLSVRELNEACQMWANLQNFVLQHHPHGDLAQRLVNSFDTNIMSHFRGMLKRRQTKGRFL